MPEDIYEGNNKYRYAIGIKGKNPLIFLGNNPSTGTPDNPDRVMKRAEHFALDNEFELKEKFDSWILFNLYPQRKRNSDSLDQNCDEIIHEENLAIIKDQLPKKSTVVAAWGELIIKRKYLFNCLKEIEEILNKKEVKWKHIGSFTKTGHPRNLLFLKNDEKIFDFDINNYLRRF